MTKQVDNENANEISLPHREESDDKKKKKKQTMKL